MSNENEILIVLGSKRFASNSNKDVWIQPPLIGDRRTMVEGDRSVTLNLVEQFNTERQESDTFRLSGKIVNIFNNTVSGKTTYTPYRNILYYTNAIANATANIPPNPSVAWEGYPQFDEFTMVRDSSVNGHRTFIPKSSTTYNWSIYASYAYSSDTQQQMAYTNEDYNVTNNFVVSDGIPFVMDTSQFNGKNLVYFNCGTKHNLTPGEWVELNIPSNPTGLGGQLVFQVYDLGNGIYGSEENVFSIYNLKFPVSQTTTGTFGTFKRIGNIQNSGETKSIYYVRLHKILTNENESDVSKMGFEHIPFSNQQKVEYSALTPNLQQRVSIKENSQSYSFTFKKDLNINEMVDNNMKPITDVFVTIVNKGYYGWFNKPTGNNINALQKGWSFNFHSDSLDDWWVTDDDDNLVNIPVSSYNKISNGKTYTFYYNQPLKIDDVLSGDFCEYNDIEQMEYVVSNCKHKITFNDVLYTTQTPTSNNPPGYFYNPHNSIKLRDFADSVTTAVGQNVNSRPAWAYFSQNLNSWLWRTILDYGVFLGS